LKTVENLEKCIKIKEMSTAPFNEFGNEERNEYEKQVASLKEQLDVLTDRSEALKEYSGKLERNERYFL
jgi:hypothetical protein